MDSNDFDLYLVNEITRKSGCSLLDAMKEVRAFRQTEAYHRTFLQWRVIKSKGRFKSPNIEMRGGMKSAVEIFGGF